MELKKLLQDFVNEPYENLLGMARSAFAELKPVFDQASQDGNGSNLLIGLFATSLAVDGKLTELEYKFVNDLFGNISYEDVKSLVEMHYKAEMVDLMNNLVDSCGVELKSKLLTLCCCFLAVDETISRDEIAFILKLCE